jgi:acetyltransferase-like isoleucine patch superfamily enzyme
MELNGIGLAIPPMHHNKSSFNPIFTFGDSIIDMTKISAHAIIQTTDIGRNVRIDEFVVIRPRVRIGSDVVIHPHVVINEDVSVGDGVEIFPSAVLGKERKGADELTRKSEFTKRLTIGPNCSVGPNAVIFYDVEIGNNARIEAGAVVTREVPSSGVVMGIPAQIMHHIAKNNIMVHDFALLESGHVGAGTRIWAHAHILPGARIGEDCNICDQTFIENDVVIGNRVTIKSGVHIWDGARIEDDVFIGPDVAFTNDRYPRSKRYPKKFQNIVIRKGASIGANATLLSGIMIGENAMVGAGSVVTKDVPANALVVGNPARFVRTLGDDKERTS